MPVPALTFGQLPVLVPTPTLTRGTGPVLVTSTAQDQLSSADSFSY